MSIDLFPIMCYNKDTESGVSCMGLMIKKVKPEDREKVKTDFNWDDREKSFTPCEYCQAVNDFPCCNDGVTTSACNHCDYNIVVHCLEKNV